MITGRGAAAGTGKPQGTTAAQTPGQRRHAAAPPKRGSSLNAAPVLVREFTPNLGVSPIALSRPFPTSVSRTNLVAACFSGGGPPMTEAQAGSTGLATLRYTSLANRSLDHCLCAHSGT